MLMCSFQLLNDAIIYIKIPVHYNVIPEQEIYTNLPEWPGKNFKLHKLYVSFDENQVKIT